MLDLVTMLLGTFALYILLYGACWEQMSRNIDETDS